MKPHWIEKSVWWGFLVIGAGRLEEACMGNISTDFHWKNGLYRNIGGVKR